MRARLLTLFERVGADPGDDLGLRLKKRVLVAFAVMIGVAAIVWGAIYLAFDEPLAASIPWSYSVASLISLGVFTATRRYQLFQTSQLTLMLVLPFLLQLVLGGLVPASAVILWSLFAPLGAMLMSGPRLAVPWFGAYVGLVVLAEFIQPVFGFDNNLSTGEVALFFVLNIVGVSTIFFVTLHYFVGQRDRAYELLGIEQARSDRLLLNVLPKEIAVILKEEERTIADHIPAMSVLFADMVEFTPISERLSPEEVVHFLNEVFSYFDALSDKYGCEKIRTIGDSYMVACGIPIPRPDHAKALARMAIEMRDYISKLGGSGGEEVQFRFGLNSGPAVAGVIGKAKFHYDVWGDTINTASRMESHGVPGKIQITAATYELLKDSFLCEYRGQIEVKGKGSLQTWFLEAERHDRN